MEKLINTFKAKDHNNKLHYILEYQTQIYCGTAADPNATRSGLSRFETGKGEAIKKVSENEFVLVSTNNALFRI